MGNDVAVRDVSSCDSVSESGGIAGCGYCGDSVVG